MADLFQDRIVRMPELIQLVGYRHSSIYSLIASGKFPRGFKLVRGGRAVGWRLSVIMRWIDSCEGLNE
ncbi:MAG: AlpA family phage regulatory protein [Nitrosospira sp.]|nr:AlpA family phage regulatory protein [Nitrosospira sp.]